MPRSKEIAYENALKQIETAAKEYRNFWNRDICESVKIEEYGFNEFLVARQRVLKSHWRF